MKTNLFNGIFIVILFLLIGCNQSKPVDENLQVKIDKQASEGIWYGADSLSYGIIGVEEGQFNFTNGKLSDGYIDLDPQKIDTLQYQNGQSATLQKLPSKFKIERVEEAGNNREGATHTLVGRFEYSDPSVLGDEVRLPVVMNYEQNQLVMTSKSADKTNNQPNLAFHIIADIDNQELVQQYQQEVRPRQVELPVKIKERQDSLMRIKKRVPTKIVLRLEMKKRVYQKGDTLNFEIGLYNDNNEYAAAPKALDIKLFNRTEKSEPLKSVRFEPGQSLLATSIILKDEGVLELLAIHPELYAGSLFIKVMPRYGSFVPRRHEGYRVRLATFQPNNSSYIEAYSQSRSFKANGKDSAEVSLFLFDQEGQYPDGVRLNIISSYGSVHPSQLIVKGDEPGIVKLVSKDQEDVTLQIIANPNIEVVNNVKVNFVPPVTYIQCVSSPPSIHFLEKAKILVRLLDEDSAALTVKTPWEVSLEISEGGGEISPQLITIQPNKFEDKAEFAPKSFIGTAKVRAVSSNLYANNNTITVTWPVLIIIASIIGGLVGGLISYFNEGDKKKKWKIFTGFFTGMVLYWAIIVFGIVDFAPDILLNVFSVFIISLIGGYLGVGSINFVLKKFGLSKA